MSTDRVVQITGKPNTCSDCVREVLELLKTVSIMYSIVFILLIKKIIKSSA